VGSGARGALGGIWGGIRWVGRELAEPFRARPGSSGQLGGDLRVWLISSDVVFEAIVALIVVLVAIVVMILVYGLVNDIPLLRVIVAIFGAASFWVFVAIQILYRLQRALGPVSAMVVSFLLAFVLAVPFGAWLIHQTWLDRILDLFG
jgi:ABC-type proline/glycine betaine transport system permease subunit